MPDRILVVGPSWVGDLVMAQSLLKLLRQLKRNTTIDVMAPAWCQPLLKRMPEVTEAIVQPVGHGQLGLAQRYRLGRALRAQRYDQAIIIPRTFKSALIPLFARIPVRTGFLGELRYGLINDVRARETSRSQPMLGNYMRLATTDPVSKPPQPELTIDPQAQKEALEQLGLQHPGGGIVGIAPGAEAGPAKRWPAARFAELADALSRKGKTVWIFGSEKERAVGETIMNESSGDTIVNLCGRTTLPQAVDLLACCDSVVANDSGLMHMAAAAGCHVVGIYGSSSPHYTPPLTNNKTIIYHALSCSPCFKKECPLGHLDCLNGVTAAEVLESL